MKALFDYQCSLREDHECISRLPISVERECSIERLPILSSPLTAERERVLVYVRRIRQQDKGSFEIVPQEGGSKHAAISPTLSFWAVCRFEYLSMWYLF